MRQKRLLLILAALLVAAVIYAWLDSPVQQRVTPGTRGDNGLNSSGKGSAVTTFQRLRLTLPDPDAANKVEVTRDVFNFFTPPRKVVKPKPEPVPKVDLPPVIEQPVVVPPVPPPVIQPVPQPRTSFRLVGQLVKEERTVVFLGLGSELYVVRVGERFGPDKKFQATEVKDGLLLIQEQGFDTPISVRLSPPKPE